MTKKKTDNKPVSKEEGKYADLPGAVVGEVVVRFPPEASGFLHIGHAKAALLNQYYQLAFKGKLIFRFDDTNPEKEREDFEDVIREDVELLRIKPDICSYTSDHFDLYIEKCEELIKNGKAYVDDTPADQMKIEREQRQESKNRANTVERNLQMWSDMKAGSEYGITCCVRAKIDMNSNNGCMRDPTIFRCKKQLHPRTGDKYNVYPTYDFACPIIDSIENVTHALRTTEYTDRDEQYYWVIDALNLRKPIIWAYSRLNMTHTVLSKRKLTWFVEQGIVTGWDDPRMPTVRGILRRGLTVDGLKEFIMAQGSSRSVVFMEWDKIWSFNKKFIDPIAPRYMAVEQENHVEIKLENVNEDHIMVNVHPKNKELGQREVKVSSTVYIDQCDAQSMKVDDSVTLINWGNIRVNRIEKNDGELITRIYAKLNLDDKDFKKTLKVTWVNEVNTPANACYYENLIRKPVLGKDDDFKNFVNYDSKREVTLLTEDLKHLKKGDIIQILRKGFFIVDQAADNQTGNPVLISIADGSTDLNIYPKSIQEWKQNLKNFSEKGSNEKVTTTATTGGDVDSAADLDKKIRQQGDKIREFKAAKKSKEQLKPEIDLLLSLKNKFKEISGKDWTPDMQLETKASSAAQDLNEKIKQQGDKIREMKAAKKSKDELKPEIDMLLNLKTKFKEETGQDWKPDMVLADNTNTQSSNAADPASKLNDQIKQQGDKIREMKTAKKSKEELKPEIDNLLKLKEEYKNLTGSDWKPEVEPARAPAPQSAKKTEKENVKKAKPAKEQQPKEEKSGSKKHQTRLGLEVKKSENLADWYTEVITKAELIEYYDVSGCYILRPWAFAIWERIQALFDKRIKSIGVKNCYFPMFVSSHALEKESTHLTDFAPEVAWVTKSGSSDLAEPIAIRPTSETVMYPSFAKWVQSYRDLPIRINQWCNVVRWEFKNPTPFLRTREFLWQEGHTAHASRETACEEVFQILDYYVEVYEELLAIPVIKGRKTEREKFAGADFTTTIEAYVSANGRGVQAATSHHLGQNFSKMFEIAYEDPNEAGKKNFAYQNSWGLSTRSIGVMIMVHSDDKGLVLPPRIAAIQVIIIPCGITAQTSAEEKDSLLKSVKELEKKFNDNDIRCEADISDHNSPGWKYNHWELRGVPIRIELGPKDLKASQMVVARRDSGEKLTLKDSMAIDEVKNILEDIHRNLFQKARQVRDEHLIVTESWQEFLNKLDEKCIIMAPFCGKIDCEEEIKKNSAKEDVQDASGPLMGAKSLCIPLNQPKTLSVNQLCVNPNCKTNAINYTLFGRSY